MRPTRGLGGHNSWLRLSVQIHLRHPGGGEARGGPAGPEWLGECRRTGRPLSRGLGGAANEPTGLRIPATKKGRAQSGHGLSYSLKLQLALVALLPDSHLLGILDQLVTEVGVGNGDECLGPLPGGQTLQVHLTVLGHKPVDVGAGRRNDRA